MFISVIMPTLNEAQNLRQRAAELLTQGGSWEWIVSDGGSQDETIAVAQECGATVIVAPKGRGPQLDWGARAANGDILLFLHADTALPEHALQAIVRACGDPAIVGGNFRLHFDDESRAARFFERLYVGLRKCFGWFFGDSAIFVRRTTFEQIGGFGDAPIMEDHIFVKVLKARGRTAWLPLAVTTSARRYRARPLRMLARWMGLMLLFELGVSPTLLARFYPPHGCERQS